MNARFREETFRLHTEYIPLCDLLKICDIAETGGVAGLLIVDGEIMVDGEVELRKRAKIRSGQVVSGDGFEIHVITAP
ncbi:RNA-binding S4 domain-containing protein [Sphaerisporangium sp. NPDC005288]|uniref:RNA-binding S4 domain-containing protein n=1 Tax=Sphaerisporangium rhizosphaerae TaxID=2269375 RepID=A0ABW2P2T1_9ACTN